MHHKPDPITGDYAEGVRGYRVTRKPKSAVDPTRSERMAVVDVVRLLETNKAKLAFLVPFLTAVVAIVSHWLVTGEWNNTELMGSVAALLSSLLAAFGAWVAKPGPAEVLMPGPVADKDPVL
jgi:hypothetical protein